MRRLALFTLFPLLLLCSASAQTSAVAPVSRKDPRSMASGGASLLFASGYDSFFGNPAGFAGEGSLSLGDLSLWGYMPTTPLGFNKLKLILSDVQPQATDAVAAFDRLLADNSGQVGFGGSVGLGWAGKGFGLGFNMVSEARVLGSSLSASNLAVANQLNAVIGFGLPLRLGFVSLDLGADARVFYRLDSVAANWSDAQDLVLGFLGYQGYDSQASLAKEWMTGGFGYALDAGATLKIGPLVAGFMARNLFGQLRTGDVQVSDLIQNSNLPMDGADLRTIEPSYTAGVGLRFNEGGLVAPSLYAETEDILGLVSAVKTGLTDTDALLAKLKLGGELRLLKIFLLRGGLNLNCFSLGAGVDLHLIRVDLALFGEDIGAAEPRSGFSVRAALKL